MVAVAVVIERAVVVDDAVIGIERSQANNELVGGERRAGCSGRDSSYTFSSAYLT